MSSPTAVPTGDPHGSAPLEGAADPAIGRAFLAAYASHNWDALRTLVRADVTWDLPGVGPISGRADGVDAVIARVRKIVDGGTKTEFLHLLTGTSGIALSLHNTGHRSDGRVLDEYLMTLLRVEDGAITAIETYLSDVAMMQTYFEEANSATG